MDTTYYEVAWGIEEHERTVRIDYGDGMAYSQHAEANATKVFLDFVKAGVKVGFFVNGVHKDGYDFAEEWAAWDEKCEADRKAWRAEDEAFAASEPAVEHKTLTGLFFANAAEPHLNWSNMHLIRDKSSWAKCSCGWREVWDNRDLARRAARRHREESGRMNG